MASEDTENNITLSIRISARLAEILRKGAFKAKVSRSEYVRMVLAREGTKRG